MYVGLKQMQGLGETEVQAVQVVLRLRVPDDHSNCPLGEKYGAIPEDCSGLVGLSSQAEEGCNAVILSSPP